VKTIGEKISECRAALDLTQQQLADKTEVSQRTISKYETGAAEPSRRNLLKICQVLGVSESYLKNPEIEDPSYGVEEAPYIEAMRQKYGKKGAADMEGLLAGVQAMFAGGDVPQSDKDLFFQAVMQAYVETKQEAKEKFTPNSKK